MNALPVAKTSRRGFIASALAAATATATPNTWAQSAAGNPPSNPVPRYRIAVCDWMILKRQKLGAFSRTREIGADGLEVDMGSLGDRETFENALADPNTRSQFLETAQQHGLTICSLAMSGFYAQSFAERPTVMRMVEDCLTTMKQMKVAIAFLPLGVQSDLVRFPDLRPEVVRRLKSLAKIAADADLVIGIETSLDAKKEAALLDDIDSPSIRSYFNFANALQAGRNVSEELQSLGSQRICQIHCTDEDGVLLQDNRRLDLREVKNTLDQMNWRGWLVIERSRKAEDAKNVVGNFGANTRYLKSIFQHQGN